MQSVFTKLKVLCIFIYIINIVMIVCKALDRPQKINKFLSHINNDDYLVMQTI